MNPIASDSIRHESEAVRSEILNQEASGTTTVAEALESGALYVQAYCLLNFHTRFS